MKKAFVALGALALSVLLAEGALSLFLGTSLRRIGRERTLLEKLAAQDVATDRERYLAALHTVGPYRVPEDPFVGNTLKVDADVDYIGERFHTDALGLRPRPAGPAPEGAFHIVLLGDSVAYGDGLSAAESLAAQLEDVLRAASPDGARAIACSAVAVPGWNYRNSTRHLLDHLDVVKPDLVLFIPVENDLDDGFGVTEAGQRRLGGPDAASARPLCPVAPPYELFRVLGVKKLGPRGLARYTNELGIDGWAMLAGLSATSRARLDDMTATLAHLAERLARVGAKLVLAPYDQHDLHRMVRARLLERGVDLPVVPLLDDLKREDQLGKNDHPNAETTRAMALWTARSLAELHLLPFELARPLPDVPARLAGRRARELAADELAAWRAEYERAQRAALSPRIEPAELVGFFQVYGGLNADGTLGTEAALVLPPGRALRVVLAGAADAPGLYPLAVEVDVDGAALGEVVLAAPADERTVELALAPAQASAPFEVRLVPRDWVLARVLERLTPVAARCVRVESVP